MKKTLIAVALVLAFASGIASAMVMDPAAAITLSGTYGSGSNASYLVVDFGPSTSYAFKYLWSTPAAGTVSGLDMINALSDQQSGLPGLVFTTHYAAGIGTMVDAISYGANSGVGNYPDPWWNYWTGVAGGKQESSWIGCADRELANGSIDSWVFTTDWTQAPRIPGVPEPSSLMALCSLIGLAGSAKLLRGRSSK